jgi:hypothetical protein
MAESTESRWVSRTRRAWPMSFKLPIAVDGTRSLIPWSHESAAQRAGVNGQSGHLSVKLRARARPESLARGPTCLRQGKHGLGERGVGWAGI